MSRQFTVALALALALLIGFLALPMVGILVHVGPGKLASSFGEQVTIDALRVTLETSAISLALIVVVGTPAAYLLARRPFPGRAAVLGLIALPVVLPPAVAGLGLLVAFGPDGILGPALTSVGITLPLTMAAVVLAQTFVAAPFFVGMAYASFSAVDQTYLDAARTLGAGPARVFWRVGVPLSRAGLAGGAALAWARAVGEFGATLMFAGSFQGVTQTAPLAIYAQFGTDLPGALALGAVLLVVSVVVLVGTRLVRAW
ncbi:MAG TPA: ABC transporter permease [Solirubrobacteraceae bacterium]